MSSIIKPLRRKHCSLLIKYHLIKHTHTQTHTHTQIPAGNEMNALICKINILPENLNSLQISNEKKKFIHKKCIPFFYLKYPFKANKKKEIKLCSNEKC